MRSRNLLSRRLFSSEAPRLAGLSQRMARRFQEGGRLLAVGVGAQASDAEHVSVEFVHPVIVGKRALPALDFSANLDWALREARPGDILLGMGPPEGDPRVFEVMAEAVSRGLLTVALPGQDERFDYRLEAFTDDPFVHQEMIEILYHTLWETVHVFLEHQRRGHDVGPSQFLYPFLGETAGEQQPLVEAVARSIVEKSAEDEGLRDRVAEFQSDRLTNCVQSLRSSLGENGKLLTFGNGGSATDANDFAYDCAFPPPGLKAVRALSLSREPANLTAIANDIGVEAVFVRQLIAHAEAGDVAFAISTSGNSRNVVACLREARRRGLKTVALLGGDGGEIGRRQLADHLLLVPCDYIPRIQEVQASIYHLLLEALT